MILQGLRAITGLLCALFAAGLPGYGAAAPANLYADHPLSGTLWDTRSGQRIDVQALIAQAARADWVLIGEKHDNAEHHRLQAQVVGALGRSGRRLAVVWEMAEPEHAAALHDASLALVGELGGRLDWETRGWPAWSEYQAIAEQALTHGLPMLPGKPPRDLVRRFARGAALPDDIAARLATSAPYAPDMAALVSAEMKAAHCDRLPEAALASMVSVQWLWDASMAAAMREAVAPPLGLQGAILIAGSGHVREDRGVPWHLPGQSITLSLVEVTQGRKTASDYAAFDWNLFDFVWFTARVDENDPCDALDGISGQ